MSEHEETRAEVFHEAIEAQTPVGTVDIEYGNGWAVGAAAGYTFGMPVRVEGEFTFVTSDTTTTSSWRTPTIAYTFTDRADVTLGYRHVRTEERELGTTKLDEAAMHFVEVGLRFRFGR